MVTRVLATARYSSATASVIGNTVLDPSMAIACSAVPFRSALPSLVHALSSRATTSAAKEVLDESLSATSQVWPRCMPFS